MPRYVLTLFIDIWHLQSLSLGIEFDIFDYLYGSFTEPSFCLVEKFTAILELFMKACNGGMSENNLSIGHHGEV